MFTKSNPHKQIELFGGVSQSLPEKKQKILADPKEWHNIFYTEVTSKIDETIFGPLYHATQGRPNASIRVLIGMLILKEGHGWTDEQLFDQCRFNLRVMLALGLANMKEDVPVESTYYDFKSKVESYAKQHEENIIEKSFRQITQDQIKRYKVLANHIRMDSKLIQSNIQRCTRLQLIIQTVRTFYMGLDDPQKKRIVKKYDREFLDDLSGRTATNHTYRMTNEEKEKWLNKLGHTIKKLLNIYLNQGADHYEVLKQLYEEQYEEKSKDIDPKDRSEIGSDSIQSPHDVDAQYRKKGHGQDEQKVTGYVANITETCHENQINLITDVQLAGATRPDNEFMCAAVEKTEQLGQERVQHIWTDGAFDSIDNRLKFNDSSWAAKRWHLPKTKGGKVTYSFEGLSDGSIQVTDLKTGQKALAELDKKGRYRVKLKRGKSDYRYFEKQTVESYLILNKVRIEDKPGFNKRPNVESTIHQVFCKLDGRKTRYRGLIRHEIYVLSRCLWTNYQRIKAKQYLDFAENHLLSLGTSLLHTLKGIFTAEIQVWQLKINYRLISNNR